MHPQIFDSGYQPALKLCASFSNLVRKRKLIAIITDRWPRQRNLQ